MSRIVVNVVVRSRRGRSQRSRKLYSSSLDGVRKLVECHPRLKEVVAFDVARNRHHILTPALTPAERIRKEMEAFPREFECVDGCGDI